MGGPKMPL